MNDAKSRRKVMRRIRYSRGLALQVSLSILVATCCDNDAVFVEGFSPLVSTVVSPTSSGSSYTRSTTTTTTSTALASLPWGGNVVDMDIDGLFRAFQAAAPTPDPQVLQEAGEAGLGAMGQDVLTFLAASVAVVPLSRWLNLTPVLGFILAGCLLGPYGMGMFSNTEADLQLGDFGILFLLFSEGLNLSPGKIRDLGSYYGLGVLQMLLSMLLLFVGISVGGPLILQYVAPVLRMDSSVTQLFRSPVEAFCIAAAGALSSSAFVIPVLKDKGWENRPEGVAALSVLLLQDLAVAPLLVIIPLLAGSGPQTSAELGWLAAKATVGFGAVLALGSVLLRFVFDIVAAARSTETFVASSLLVALGMGQAADALGLSATTGAFAAGVLLAGNRYRAQIKADIRPFEGILLGIFFMTSGASLDPSVVIHNLPTLLAGMTVFILIKAAVLYLAGPALFKTKAQAARVAITLAGGGEFSLILFKLAQDLGVLPESLAKLLLASVIISMSMTPLLGEIADAAGNFVEAREGQQGAWISGEEHLSTAEAQMLFDKIDTDDSGTIDFDELRIALVERGLGYTTIADIFMMFDTDGNGTICREEWTAGIKGGLLATTLTGAEPLPVRGRQVPDQMRIARDAVVICGFTEFGKEMYNVLDAAGLAWNGGVVAFDLNPSRVAAGVLAGATVVYGNGASPDLLRAAGVSEPRAVIVAYRSEAQRLEATTRLRESLPRNTPIYCRLVSGQSLGRQELLDAGATDVVNERTEAALRFGELLGAFKTLDEAKRIRGNLPTLQLGPAAESREEIPGIPEDRLSDLAEEFGCTQRDLVKLHKVFSSLPNVGDDNYVAVSELGDILLRDAGDGPIDDETLARWTELADGEGGGTLSFVDFARAYYGGSRRIAGTSK